MGPVYIVLGDPTLGRAYVQCIGWPKKEKNGPASNHRACLQNQIIKFGRAIVWHETTAGERRGTHGTMYSVAKIYLGSTKDMRLGLSNWLSNKAPAQPGTVWDDEAKTPGGPHGWKGQARTPMQLWA